MTKAGTINFGKVTVTNATITSVEKGTFKPGTVAGTVIAFAVRPEGYEKAVKVIVKDKLAHLIYESFLSNGGTIDEVLYNSDKTISVDRKVVISFDADIKEDRTNELVLRNPQNVVFDYKFVIQGQ